MPFKNSFLSRRVFVGLVLVVVSMNAWNFEVTTTSRCCINPERETIEHLFLNNEVVDKVWSNYNGDAGIIDQRFNLKQSVRLWRNQKGN